MDATVMPVLSTSCGTKRDKSMSWTSAVLIWKQKVKTECESKIWYSWTVYIRHGWIKIKDRYKVATQTANLIKQLQKQIFFFVCF